MTQVVQLSKEKIDEIFEQAENQTEAFLALYGAVYPNGEFEKIGQLIGWPVVNEATNDYIWMKFMELDQAKHPNVLAGGLWMNSGFSVFGDDLEDWRVRQADYVAKQEGA